MITDMIKREYCIIRREGQDCGLCSFIITNLGGINYCLNKNWIPIIDMQTNKNIYLEEKQVGIVNAWEFYFEQPMLYGLKRIPKKSVIIDGCDVLRPNLSMEFLTNDQMLEYWRKIFRQYIRFQPDIRNILEDKYREYFYGICKEDVVGVLCRGTDYRILKPQGHPIQPENEYMISFVKNKMHELKKEKIFLVTEDMSIVAAFKQEFGKDVFYCEGTRFELLKSIYLANYIETINADKFKQGLEYLTSIYCLSKCDVMIAGRTSGSVVAHLMAENSQKAYFVDLGIYGIDDKEN